MTLKEQVQADLIASMKAGDEIKKNTLKMLKAAIMKWEVEGTKKEADDQTILGLIAKEIKQRKEAADGFRMGGKIDMAEKEEAEAKILQMYLPEQMNEEEVRKEVANILKENGISSKAEMGKAMSAVMAKMKGKADGKLINQVVGSLLQ
jgi:uncharacterized protein